MNWEKVRDLENLTKLNMEIAVDALDDTIIYLTECHNNLEKALQKYKQVKKSDGPSCIGYS